MTHGFDQTPEGAVADANRLGAVVGAKMAEEAENAQKAERSPSSVLPDVANRAAEGAVRSGESVKDGKAQGGSGDGPIRQKYAEKPDNNSKDGKLSSESVHNGKSQEQLKEIHKSELNEFMKKLEKTKDGVQILGTGDILVHDEGRQILFMPNGDKLTISPSGSYDLKSGGPVRVSSKFGLTTLEYPNGDSVSFDRQGVLSITRGDIGISFARRANIRDLLPGTDNIKPLPDKLPQGIPNYK